MPVTHAYDQLHELQPNRGTRQGRKPVVGEEVRDPTQFRPDLNVELAGFLIKACAPYREHRFGTAIEMRKALEQVRGEP